MRLRGADAGNANTKESGQRTASSVSAMPVLATGLPGSPSTCRRRESIAWRGRLTKRGSLSAGNCVRIRSQMVVPGRPMAWIPSETTGVKPIFARPDTIWSSEIVLGAWTIAMTGPAETGGDGAVAEATVACVPATRHANAARAVSRRGVQPVVRRCLVTSALPLAKPSVPEIEASAYCTDGTVTASTGPAVWPGARRSAEVG